MNDEAKGILQAQPPSVDVLALHGGPPVIADQPTPVARWGGEELANLSDMVGQNSLFYWKGPQTEKLIEKFRAHYPLKHLMPCSSGTAAVHVALAAAGIAPGDEVIVPPITDMGSLIGILFQQAVPVFADLEPWSYNLDPKDVALKVTKRTKAIVAVHLLGNPCRIERLREIADEHNLILIEDCAQAWGATANGRPVGTFGHLACFSFNDYKHVSCGEGGMVASNDDELAGPLQKFCDKGYDRIQRSRLSAILAANYRISEPQSAVAAAQMDKMPAFTERYHQVGDLIARGIANLPGVQPLLADPDDKATYFVSAFRLDLTMFACDRVEFVQALAAEGVFAQPGLLAMPIYKYPVFQNHNFFAGTWPIRDFGMTTMDYTKVCCPVAEEIIDTMVTLEIHQGMDDTYAEGVARSIKKVAQYYFRIPEQENASGATF